ncbi:MAG: N-acetylmuramoyl-L-alanine amidase [Phycisphaerae bacterium]|nr:N-acetylmuramoyl-L-alanine amidase [Phycisphaerae bacterium]
MTLRDAIVFAGCFLFVAALAVAVGCSSHDPAMTTDMPFLEMDASPARPRPAATAYRPTPRPATGRSDWDAPRTSRAWRHIVMHHSATESGSAEKFDAMHRQRGWDELGYHFVITNGNGGPDGRVQVGSRWRKQKHGAHTGGTPGNEYNEHGIGVCLVGNFMTHSPSPAQLRSVTELTEYLAERYGISPGHILAHKDAPNQKTECCGRVFYAYVHSRLKQDVQRQLAGR